MIQTEKSGTLACNNDQTLFVFKQTSFGAYEDGIGTLRASGGDMGGAARTLLSSTDRQQPVRKRL